MAKIRSCWTATALLVAAILGGTSASLISRQFRMTPGMAEWNGGPPDRAGLPTGLATVREVVACPDSTTFASRSAGETVAPSALARAGLLCQGVVYVWSPLMPLSRLGIGQMVRATRSLGIDAAVVSASQLHAWLDSSEINPGGHAVAVDPERVREMIAAGATVHYPAVLVYGDGVLRGSAIVGFKTANAYARMVGQRLAGEPSSPRGRPTSGPGLKTMESGLKPGIRPSAGYEVPGPDVTIRDIPIRGNPSAYFRWVRHWNALSYSIGRKVYLLDLEHERITSAPGFIDFIPSPDGRIFVTPGPNRQGLEFYDAAMIFSGHARGARAFFVDSLMKDQYPSIGVLRSASGPQGGIVYRILTSWFDRVLFRDYELLWSESARVPSIRPLGRPVVGCEHVQVSLPILSPDGAELAGRDEATGTTKIFALDPGGRCREVLNLEVQTGKVSWREDASQIAFAMPSGSRHVSGAGEDSERESRVLAGIFIFDRRELHFTRVQGSEGRKRLTFPEFMEKGAIAFLMPTDNSSTESSFRIVCCYAR